MSAQPTTTTAPAPAPEGQVNIEIDGVALHAPKGSMIIQAADKAGIPIPRFCYHQKLPIAANCRMCMVEAELGGKPISGTPEDFAKVIAAETEKWAKVVISSGATVE